MHLLQVETSVCGGRALLHRSLKRMRSSNAGSLVYVYVVAKKMLCIAQRKCTINQSACFWSPLSTTAPRGTAGCVTDRSSVTVYLNKAGDASFIQLFCCCSWFWPLEGFLLLFQVSFSTVVHLNTSSKVSGDNVKKVKRMSPHNCLFF